MKAHRLVLPNAGTLERIGLAGRARARRLSAQALNDTLDDERKKALEDLLKHEPTIGRSRLTWLRTPPHSTSALSMLALLERLTFVRAIALPRHLGDNIHPARLAKFAREGAVAPVNLLSDFGKRRRIASLAAQMLELETTLTDSAIALFERLTGRLFTRSRNSQDRSWSASKTQAGRLIRLFGGAIDAMVRARRTRAGPVRCARRGDRLGPPGGVARGDRRVGRSGDARPPVAGDPTLRAASPVRAGIPGGLRVRRSRLRPRPAQRRDPPQRAQPHGQAQTA